MIPEGYIPPGLEAAATDAFVRMRWDAHRAEFPRTLTAMRALRETHGDITLALAYEAGVGALMGFDTSALIEQVENTTGRPPEELILATAFTTFARGDFAGAAEGFDEFLVLHPGDPYATHAAGFSRIDSGRVEDGVRMLERFVADRPDFVPALNHLAFGYLKLDQADRAIQTAERFVERDPTNASALDSLATLLGEVGRVDDAIERLLKAVALDPDAGYAWFQLGQLQERAGDPVAAAASFATAARSSSCGPRMRAMIEKAEQSLQGAAP